MGNFKAMPWASEDLTPSALVERVLESVLEVDTRTGAVVFNRSARDYRKTWQPYRPVTYLRIMDRATGFLHVLGVKELVWAEANRRFPSGIRLKDPLREEHRLAIDNLYQVDADPKDGAYGWKYDQDRYPALVKVHSTDDLHALVYILGNNWVLGLEEERDLFRRKAKLRLMKQITQTNLEVGAFWRVPLRRVGRVRGDLCLIEYRDSQLPLPDPSLASFPGVTRVKTYRELNVWSTARVQPQKLSSPYVRQRRQELAEEAQARHSDVERLRIQEEVGVSRNRLDEALRVRRQRAIGRGDVTRYVDQVLFPSFARHDFDVAAGQAICAGALVDGELAIHLSHD